jgi:Mg/Co/Ni transporter MgtE|tara:strand:- start:1494 stop:1745 length:252 start_codon:yes stop_codon:yes gene_type:complete
MPAKKKKSNMLSETKEKKLRDLLTAEMVSRVTLAESINIIHNIAIGEVEKNLEEMSDQEKESALEELSKKVEETQQKTEGQKA